MKRYEEYKDSGVPWIGEIPKDWEVKKLKYSVTLCAEKESYSSKKYIGLENVTSFSGKYVETVTQEIEGLSTSFVVGDVLFGKLRPYLAKCLRPEFSGICSSEFLVLRNYKGNNRYLHYLLLSSKVIETINASTYGAKMPRANWSFIGQMQMPHPMATTQHLIADYLDRKTAAIDSLIEDKQKLIELLKEKRQTVISEAVTKGLDKNAKMKDSGVEWIGEIPEDWKRTKLKNLLSIPITDGPHETPEILDEGIPFISAEAIKNLQIDFNLKRGFISIDNHLKFCKKCKPEYGDIFMIKSGATTGNVAMVETYNEFSIWSPLALIRSNPNIINNKYLFYCLQSRPFKLQVELFWSFGTQQNIGMGVLGNLYLSYPEIDAQIEIVSYLNTKTSEIDNLVDDIAEQIEKLKSYRQAIISEAVTGKVAI